MMYAIIKDSKVVNTVEWDGVSNWNPPAGCTAIVGTVTLPAEEEGGDEIINTANIGDTWDGEKFVPSA